MKKTIESPLEEFFSIQRGSTESKFQANSELPAVPDIESEFESEDDYDAEDRQIKQELSTVYDYAIDAFETQQLHIQSLDPKYAARNAEVAAQFLKIALDTTSERIKNRDNKKKLQQAAMKSKDPASVNNTQNNVYFGSRNELLKMLSDDGNDHDN